jgi:arylsulfatase A-like enzyme
MDDTSEPRPRPRPRRCPLPRRQCAAALTALVLAACQRRGEPGPAPAAPWLDTAAPPSVVLWVVIDTLRADALGCYGADARGEDGAEPSPQLDRLAAEAVLFEQCYATAPWTAPSLVAQFTGRYPFDHGTVGLLEPVPAELVTVAEVLRADGWRTAGVNTNFVATGALGFGQGFERWDDGLARGHEGSTAPEAVRRALELLDELDAPGAGEAPVPRFLYTLLFEPHFRYLAHPGLRFGPGFGSDGGPAYTGPLSGGEELADLLRRLEAGELTERDLDFLRGLYASEVAAVDRAFGELRAGLAARGLWDEALVVLTADHGEELGHHGWIGHTANLRQGLVHVPLLVKLPRSWPGPAGGTRRAQAVSQVDLARTVLDLLRVPVERRGPHLQSENSFLPTLLEDRAPSRRYLYLHTHYEPLLATSSTRRAHQFGVVDGPTGWKWVVDHLGPPGVPVRGRLFELRSDPDEASDRSESGRLPPEQQHLARLRGLLAQPLLDRSGAEPVPAPEPER